MCWKTYILKYTFAPYHTTKRRPSLAVDFQLLVFSSEGAAMGECARKGGHRYQSEAILTSIISTRYQ